MEPYEERSPTSYFFKAAPLEGIGTGMKICLFLDFDGTLAPIRNNPGECVLPSVAKDLLESLAASGVCPVVVMSGRSLPDIRERADVDGIYHGGNHGLLVSGPAMTFVHPEALSAMPLIEDVRKKIEKEITGLGGVWIEDKEFSFTLHFREAAKGTGRIVGAMLRRALSGAPERHHLAVLKGKKVLELIPHVAWDKGRAALFVLSTFGGGHVPVYVGDDVTDESAFTALSGKGITVRVGRSKKTAARYYLKGQWEVLPLLEEVARVAEARSGRPGKRLVKGEEGLW